MPKEILQTISTLLLTLDLLGTLVAAIGGASAGIRKRLDIVGLATLAFVSGTAGGVIRDVLIGAVPPAALSNWRYVAVTIPAAGVTFLWYPKLRQFQTLMAFTDAAALGLFTVAGTQKAMVYGISPVLATLLGTCSAVGGGIVRDLLVSEIPFVLRPGELYATAALIGALVVVVGHWLGLDPAIGAVAGAVLCFGVRWASKQRGWKLPPSRHADPEE